MAKKKVRSSRPLVVGYLERVSSKVLSEHSVRITGLVGRRHGVYALYKGDRLYYVGLASNLKGRLDQHLRDKHKGKWTRFSLYLVHNAAHIKELESLVLRIADPKGNTTRGRMKRATNLRRELERAIDLFNKVKKAGYFDEPRTARTRTVRAKKMTARKGKTATGRTATLAPYVSKRFPIRATSKGKTFKARVRSDGTISFAGDVYTSPTAAARAATLYSVDGWHFWRYRNGEGEWVLLNELRGSRPGKKGRTAPRV